MATKVPAAVRQAHRFVGVPVDRARCSCSWESDSRVGRVQVGRERHRQHVADVAASQA